MAKKSSLEKGTIGGSSASAKRAKSSKLPQTGATKGARKIAKNKPAKIKAPTTPHPKRKQETRKNVKKIRAQKAATQGNKRFYQELRLKQKRANERMRQLELQDIESPAYQAVQAQLEILGKQRKGSRGRRFSETGKATYNEMELQMKMLDDFLNAQTSTLTGAKSYYDDVWNTADKNNHLSAAGITRDQWLKFWENMPQKKKDRMYGSGTLVRLLQAYTMKNGKLEPENRMSVEEIAEAIQESESEKDAYAKLGINFKDVSKARKLGALRKADRSQYKKKKKQKEKAPFDD